MTNYSKQVIVFISLLLIVLFIQIPFPAHALELQYPHVPGFGGADDTLNTLAGDLNFGQLVQFVFATSLWIAGLMAFGALVVAGFMYATSQGAPMKRMFAKNRIQSVAIGTGILLGLYIILGLVNPQLLTLGGSSFKICGGANTPPCEYPEFPNVNKGGSSAPPGPMTQCRGTTRTTTFFEEYGASAVVVANMICVNNGRQFPAETFINNQLINMNRRGVDGCTQQDVQEILAALPSTEACAGQEPAGGTSGELAINESTKPREFCEYSSAGVGSAFGAAFTSGLPNVEAINSLADANEFIRANIQAVISDCRSRSDLNLIYCKLNNTDSTPITSLDGDQLELLAQVCIRVLPN